MSETIGPISIPQEMFLNSDADIVIYGGAAGGGKSFCSLLHHMRYIHDPNYRGLIVRRTMPMLMQPGSIWDEAKDLYGKIEDNLQIRLKDTKFIFPSGGEIKFSGFERVDDTKNFQGAQISSAVFDELCQFEESQFVYIMSRLRTKAKMKTNIRATCNPDPDSFVRKWIDWWLYPKDHEYFGRPDPAKQGAIRYFVRLNNEMIWGDSREELLEKYPKSLPISMQFISATVYDNPLLIENNPGYISWLEGLPRVEQERLLHGNWEARESATGYFKREWLGTPINLRPATVVSRVRAWDIAGSMPSELNPNPDWTVGVLMSKDRLGKIYIEDVVRFRARHGEVLDKIIKTAKEDGSEVPVSLPREPGQAGLQAAAFFIRELADNGFYARATPTNQSKLTRFAPFAATAEAGNVSIVRGDWNDSYLQELEAFDATRNCKDDQVDATSDAFGCLTKMLNIPYFMPPDMSSNNPFNIQ